MESVKITTEYIKLDQFLKWTGCISNGSDAKFFISDGKVKVNGIIEYQRGKKIRKGDMVEFEGEKIIVE